jgi:uncharacterized Zn-binding protein involved in type VI secretion
MAVSQSQTHGDEIPATPSFSNSSIPQMPAIDLGDATTNIGGDGPHRTYTGQPKYRVPHGGNTRNATGDQFACSSKGSTHDNIQ